MIDWGEEDIRAASGEDRGKKDMRDRENTQVDKMVEQNRTQKQHTHRWASLPQGSLQG